MRVSPISLGSVLPLFLIIALMLTVASGLPTPVRADTDSPVPAAGLVLHLDADALTGLSDDEGVAAWEDLSGEGNHATQADTARQPTYKTDVMNGNPVVRFDEDFLSLPLFQIGSSDGNAIFAVLRIVSPSTERGGIVLGNWPEDPNMNVELHTSFRVRYYWSSGNPDHNPASPTGAQGDPFISAWLRNPGLNEMRTGVDGVLSAASTAGSNFTISDPFRIGVDYRTDPESIWFKGDIAELLVYDRALSDEERIEVEQYLGIKWLGWTPPQIDPTTADYDIHDPADVTTTITWNEATEVDAVTYDNAPLTPGTEYTVTDDDGITATLAILQTFLEGIDPDEGDELVFTIDFDSGGPATFTVHVMESVVSRPGPIVGGEVFPINKFAVLAPWFLLATPVIAGASLLVLRHRRTQV